MYFLFKSLSPGFIDLGLFITIYKQQFVNGNGENDKAKISVLLHRLNLT